jgi:hypothetical protein
LPAYADSKESGLEDKIKDLSGQAIHDNRLRSYSINLQTKLREK